MTDRPKYSGSPEEKEFLAVLEDKIRLALKTNQAQVTNFLDPRLQAVAETVLNKKHDLVWELEGGAAGAERQRLVLAPADIELDSADSRINLLAYQGDFGHAGAKPVTHRDYLGAILGTGIRREKLGDIWQTADGCVVAVDRDLAGYLSRQPIRIKGIDLAVQILAPGAFAPAEKEVSILTTTVASLRLDAVAAAGFRTSRAKIVSEITAGRLAVNWQEITRLDFILRAGDVISARGRGRMVLKDVSGNTTKGRVKISIEKFIL